MSLQLIANQRSRCHTQGKDTVLLLLLSAFAVGIVGSLLHHVVDTCICSACFDVCESSSNVRHKKWWVIGAERITVRKHNASILFFRRFGHSTSSHVSSSSYTSGYGKRIHYLYRDGRSARTCHLLAPSRHCQGKEQCRTTLRIITCEY